jgi:hypothetical protein
MGLRAGTDVAITHLALPGLELRPLSCPARRLVDMGQPSDRVKQNNSSLCKILGIHGGDYEELLLLGCYAVWLL